MMPRRPRPILQAAALMLLASLSPAWAETIAGRAIVVDGDTLEIRGERIRLHGGDAPVSVQLCRVAAGAEDRCGGTAAPALSDRIGASPVSCERTEAACPATVSATGAPPSRSRG